MDRREFLGAWAGLATGSVLGFSPWRELQATDPVGLQLYTVREPLSRAFEATLEAIAAMGYREVEFAGYHGRSPADAARAARALGLEPVSAHVPLAGILDEPGAVLDGAQAAGHRHLVLAWVARERRRSLDDWRRLAGSLNAFGEGCRERGLRFAYHNHDYEFEPLDGGVPYEVLVKATDPAAVGLQLDFYWLRAGGRDPREYLERLAHRVPSCHVKDMDAGGGMVDVGAGVMEWRPILSAARAAGVEHFFVEHDRPAEPLASARRSLEHLRTLQPFGRP